MAKPDLQDVYVDPASGDLRRLAGKLGLEVALGNLPSATDNSSAATAGVPVGGLYVDTSADNVVKQRTA
jgi:hypothetical protein